MRYHAVNAAIMYDLVTLHMTMSELSIGNLVCLHCRTRRGGCYEMRWRLSLVTVS